ncbi:MAG TPA: response regulator [Rectinemataceae bacterium]|nr:response regulator [Rectinemataceae bacterium]
MGGRRRYLLLVDDNPAIIAALARELQAWSQERSLSILTASSAEEALELVTCHGQDILIVLSDLRMSGMSGADLLVGLSLSHPHMVSLLLTDVIDLDEILKTSKADVFGVISKPWDTWNLRLELTMAYETAENRAIASPGAYSERQLRANGSDAPSFG